jgi:hypothetical protein
VRLRNGSAARMGVALRLHCWLAPGLLSYTPAEWTRNLDLIVVARKLWELVGVNGRDPIERAVHRCLRLQFGFPKQRAAASLSMEAPQNLRKMTAIRQVEDHQRGRISYTVRGLA